MAAFFDFCKNHKHHEWGVFVTSVTDEFGDTLIKSFVLDLLNPTLANLHSSKCTSLRVFDWLVIELSVAKPVVKYWQRHIWTNSTAKLGVSLSSVVTQHIRDFKIQILRTTDYGREVFGTGTRHMFSLHSTVASSRRCVVEGVFVVSAGWVRKQKRWEKIFLYSFRLRE